jgi:hypothetical protein
LLCFDCHFICLILLVNPFCAYFHNSVKFVRRYVTTLRRAVIFITINVMFHTEIWDSPTCTISPHSKFYMLISIQFDVRHSNIKTEVHYVLGPCHVKSFCRAITVTDVFIFSKCQTCYHTKFQDPAEQPHALFAPRKCAPPPCGITQRRELIMPGLLLLLTEC